MSRDVHQTNHDFVSLKTAVEATTKHLIEISLLIDLIYIIDIDPVNYN